LEGEGIGITASIRSENRKGWWGSGAGEIGTEIQVIDRPRNLAIRQRVEEFLGAAGNIPNTVQMIQSDLKAIDRVASDPAAVTYISFSPAFDAVRAGSDIRLLRIDRVEATEQTVRDGWYQLRRPVLLLRRDEPNPVIDAFTGFALSKEGQAIVDEQFVPYGPDVPSAVIFHLTRQVTRANTASCLWP
jgi:ABC-type phosphate transport system substrate-binding protein